MTDGHAAQEVKPSILSSLERPPTFRSLRWRLTLPLLAVIVVVAMAATYIITSTIARGIRDSQLNQLLASARAAGERTAALVEVQRREVERVAYTQNVPELLKLSDGPSLQKLVQPLAAAADLDYLVVGTTEGKELVGLERNSATLAYGASQGALLDKLYMVKNVVSGKQETAAGIVRTRNGYALFTVALVRRGETVSGVAVVGTALERVAVSLRGSSQADLAMYSPEGELLGMTMPVNEAESKTLALSVDMRNQMLESENRVPVRSLTLDGTPYQAAYVPLIVGTNLVGMVGLYQPNNMWYATDASRSLLSLAFSALAAGVIIVASVGVGWALRRMERVTRTAQALASGDPYARTGMEANDEIGELGKAIDTYAQHVQRRQDWLEVSLRAQRRETTRLTAVISSIPDGIVVQDLDGRVILINAKALALLGSKRVFRSSPLNELTAVVTDKLGAALAPGVYAMGDPTRVPLDGKVMHAQAAAVVTGAQVRIGTVIVLRDITDEVKREQARETLLTDLAREAKSPIEAQAMKGRPEDALQGFIREVNRNQIALQRLIGEIRELSALDAQTIKAGGQKALPAETLLWNVAREWQPTVKASQLELHVLVLRRGLLVLGDERRLRWAIGNLVDNAVKFTLSGGNITLMLRADDDEKYAQISIKDTGVGISAEDMPNLFTRFYRGSPLRRDGTPHPTPGTGQGLFIARRVIEAHGGHISLSSTPGQGTDVFFNLPLTSDMTLDLSQQGALSVSNQPAPVERVEVDLDTRPAPASAHKADPT